MLETHNFKDKVGWRENMSSLSGCEIGVWGFKREALLEETWEHPLKGPHGRQSLDEVGLRFRRKHLG